MIRALEDNDIKRVLEIYTPYVKNTTISFETEVPSLEEFTKRVHNIKEKYPYLVYENEGVVYGYAYASRFRERGADDVASEISVYLDPLVTGKGIGKVLMRCLLEELKKTNVLNAISCVCYPNEASERLHKSLGFKLCGHIHDCAIKFDRSLDIVFYEYKLNDKTAKFIPYPDVSNEE